MDPWRSVKTQENIGEMQHISIFPEKHVARTFSNQVKILSDPIFRGVAQFG